MKNKLIALVFGMALTLLGAPAPAQTTTPILTVGTPLVDNSPGDNKIVLSSNRNAQFRKGNAINSAYCPITSVTPAYSYTKFGVACPTPVVTPPVEPPVVTPALDQPADVKLIVRSHNLTYSGAPPKVPELFMANGKLSITVSDGGSLGGYGQVPEGYGSAVNQGLLRASFYLLAPNLEFIAHGANVEGFTAAYAVDGKKEFHTSASLMGYRFIPGAVNNTGGWIGKTTTGLNINQHIRMEDTVLRFKVTLTNSTTKTMTDVRYMRTVDPDMDDDSVPDRDRNAFATNNYIPARDLVVAGLRGVGLGHYFFLRGVTPGAVGSYYGTWVNSDPYAPLAFDAPQPIHTAAVSSGVSINLTYSVGDLAPGQAKTLEFLMGVTKTPSTIGQ